MDRFELLAAGYGSVPGMTSGRDRTNDHSRKRHAVGHEGVTQASVTDLDAFDHAAFICDWRGKVLTSNETAKNLLEGLMGKDRRIRFAQRHDALSFAAMLKAALDPSRAGEMSAMACAPAAAPANVVLRAIKLRRDVGSAAEVLVLVEKQRAEPAEALRRDFGLTAAEARVAVALAEGIGIDEICASQGVARTTIRSHLKSIYAKTDTRGQVQLVVLLNKLWRCG